MKLELKNFLIKVCDWIFGLTAIFFIVIFLIFKLDEVTSPFKEALSISVSFLSALATLGAAIIAARLFQTWKTQHNYVEQIKILSQMVITINDVLNHLEMARDNEKLCQIILNLESDQDINESFSIQKKSAKALKLSLLNLGQLENQIYLLNNNKIEQPIFTSDEAGVCPLESLLEFSNKLNIDITRAYEHVCDDLNAPGGQISYKSLDVKSVEIQSLILNILDSGDLLLRMVASKSFSKQDNPINEQLSIWIHSLIDKIMIYRDSLDTLD